MDHVASGWNGRKTINIFVPDEDANGVTAVREDFDFFWTKLARVVSRGNLH